MPGLLSTIADPQTLDRLLSRLARLTLDSQRRWGTLTPAEMLCHLGDAGDAVLGLRVTPGPKPDVKPSRILMWLAVWSPIHWPKGAETRAGSDPKKLGTRPGDFEQDRERVVSGLRAMAAAAPGSLLPVHFRFGPMTVKGWQRWAWRHVDHHLRQFGL
ncbi:MAG TPA: DinB family protein [Thermoanaerobaculia bacterium]|jgi:hypothetical protein|nr:DinB family protein [Thermoanaerobaculia bacterium]